VIGQKFVKFFVGKKKYSEVICHLKQVQNSFEPIQKTRQKALF
jgi:hypothetical protein